MPDTNKECFFFQAEDGIRDGTVTGVQTCALPIMGGAIWCAVGHAYDGALCEQQRECVGSCANRQSGCAECGATFFCSPRATQAHGTVVIGMGPGFVRSGAG